MERYVGKYVVPGDQRIVLTIERSNDHLTIQENDEPKQVLLPESDTQFFSTASDDIVRFEVNAQGQVMRMILHVDGQDIKIQRR